MTRPRYRKGKTIGSMLELVLLMESQGDAARVYWRHKVQSPGWLLSMTYRTLRGAARSGILFHAVRLNGGDDEQ